MQYDSQKVGRSKRGSYVQVRIAGQDLQDATPTWSDSLCCVCAMAYSHQQIAPQTLTMCPMPQSCITAAIQHIEEPSPSFILMKWGHMAFHAGTGLKQYVIGSM